MMHLILGNTGAGKSTYAQRYQQEHGGIIYSIDHWNATLFLPDKKESDGVDWFLERIARVDQMVKDLILQNESQGIDSILDLGFAKKKRREAFYAFAKAQQILFQLHFLDTPTSVRKQRVAKRNAEQGSTYRFEVTEADFAFMETWFEPLDDAELEIAPIITTADESV